MLPGLPLFPGRRKVPVSPASADASAMLPAAAGGTWSLGGAAAVERVCWVEAGIPVWPSLGLLAAVTRDQLHGADVSCSHTEREAQ